MSGRSIVLARCWRLLAVAAVLATVGANTAGATKLSVVISHPERLLRPLALPPGVGYLNGVSCPNAHVCFVVGQDGGSPDLGLVLTVTSTGITHTIVPSANYLIGIDCTSATSCVAVGATSSGGGVVVATSDGVGWSPVATSAAKIDAVSCAGGFCMAVQDPTGSNGRLPVLVATNGHWTTRPAPTLSALAVDCVGPRDCWIVGGGVAHSTNGGKSWETRSPLDANGPGVWSLLDVVRFTSPTHGLVAGGDQCGGDVDHCNGVVFTTNDAGATWQLATTGFIQSLTCDPRPHAGCVASFLTFTPICVSGGSGPCSPGNGNVTNGSVMLGYPIGGQWTPIQRITGVNFPSAACPVAGGCVFVGGNQLQDVGAIYVEKCTNKGVWCSADAAQLVGPSSISTLSSGLVTPRGAFDSLTHNALNLVVAGGVVLFLAFPSQLFNHTFQENYEDVVAWWRRRLGVVGRVRRRRRSHKVSPAHGSEDLNEGHLGDGDAVAIPQRSDSAGTARRRHREVVVVVALGALMGSLLDPHFGFSVASMLSYVAVVASLVTMMLLTGFVTRRYLVARALDTHFVVRALPGGLLVALICLVVSRTTQFEPGYLYGVICSVSFAHVFARREDGHIAALSLLSVTAMSVVAWLVWVPVNHLATLHEGVWPLVWTSDFLGTLVLAGLVGSTIGTLPLSFLPGGKLASWHRGAWFATATLITWIFVSIVLNPHRGSGAHHAPLVTAISLFVVFGGGSIVFYEHFRRKRARTTTKSLSLPGVPASTEHN